jgi:3-methyladenine DNA glycosylase AlkC
MMETKEPKKGQGVPKETPAQNNIAALQSSLAQQFPQLAWDGLRAELEARDFFEAGMQQQVHLMAEVSIDLLGSEREAAALVSALSRSPVEKIRGVAAFAVPIVYAADLGQQLQGLYVTGALEGTWPRELSATTLHKLIIDHGVAEILPRVRPWLKDPEPAIRRLVVEAFRPRGVMLPHITELKEDPSPLKAVLEPLLDDEADYVRKAVANNVNDVSKDNPDRVLDWAQEWMTPDASKARQWIIARGLRTLVNEGHPTALRILGYTAPANLKVVWQGNTPQRVEINQLLPFEFEIVNRSDTEALINLLLWMDEPGKGKARRTSRYQLWKGRVPPGGSKHISKRIHFVDKRSQPRVSGVYRLKVTVNGEKLEERELTFQRQ